MALWFGLYRLLGDSIWWLSLLNIAAPYLFIPLAALLAVGLACRRRAFWVAIVLPLALWALLYGPLYLPRPFTPAVEGEPFTVMSFNVLGLNASPETTWAALADGVPDILAMQEYTPGMRRVALAELGHLYPYHVEQPYPGIHGLGLLSRYPLTEIDASHLDATRWRVQIARVDVDGRSLLVYNVHLTSSNVFAYLDSVATLAQGLERDFALREAQMQRLLDDIATRDEPVIVVGDINSADLSDVQRMLRRTLNDSHRVAGRGLGHTFSAYPWRWRGVPIPSRVLRLDGVYYSGELVALESRVGREAGTSDHLPMWARLGWRPVAGN
jgi:endonuclease/exonuclease/phosphatase (EEP) superfamily protein YafD